MAQLTKKQVMETFEHLHNNPELSWEEEQTTAYVKKRLEDAGCRVTSFDDCTGVFGDIGNFSGDVPVIALRADMDALWQEVDGSLQANHSCGHDAHMTMVLGVLERVKDRDELLKHLGIRFIFQPAEEVGTGALKMVEKGAIEDVDFYYGIHLRPFQETDNGKAAPAIVHGANGTIELEIRGDDAHGARPHLNRNSIEIGTFIVNALHSIHVNPNVAHSVKVTRFQAGGRSTNIIPGSASLAIDVRAQDNEVMDELMERVRDVLDSARNLFGSEITITEDTYVAAARVHPEAQETARQAITDVLGEENTVPPVITPGGDDFHFYTIKRPHLKATMIGLGCGLSPGLHHPDMTFDHESMMNGIDVMVRILELHAGQDAG
ncbi:MULTISPECIES: M20 peptidase aminoacylase family protein [Sporosarcina]|uniref:M20 peptidase aminoacylase family protein n=1 Tax=Sporosarcina TaxID=1569 RepID=UPI00058B17BC|nr:MULTISPECIES: M20 peptidase aminoacylase family protein [Sporosarcina]WJY26081.1 M20 peptidase aminoacylase family protein [Sporosarcina sp. 0.2-SM1T-5]